MKIPKNKLIKVYWRDHASECSWRTLKDLEEWGKKEFSNPCETIGECVIENKDYIILASEKASDTYGNYTLILRGEITKIGRC